MLHGIEIEFAGHHELRYELNDWLVGRDYPFYCGTDTSAVHYDCDGFELRSLPPFDEFPAKELKDTLAKIIDLGGYTHRGCGFHVHFSGYGILNKPKINEYLRQKKYNWSCRSKWCMGGPHDRYQPLRQVSDDEHWDHYELRIFNSTLSFRGIRAMFNEAKKIMNNQEYLLPHGPKLIRISVFFGFEKDTHNEVIHTFSFSGNDVDFRNDFLIFMKRKQSEYLLHNKYPTYSLSLVSNSVFGYDLEVANEFIRIVNTILRYPFNL